MKKIRLFVLMLMAFFMPLAMQAQETVEIGTDQGTTTSSYLPGYTLYNNTLSQQLYTADEIGIGGTISSISFYNGGSTKSPNIKIYLVETEKTEFSSTSDWVVATASNLVFTGDVTFTADTWTDIAFDNDFEYDGSSNLAVIVDMNLSWSSGLACRVFTSTSNCAMYVYSDGTDYDATTPGSYTASSRMSSKNQIKLEITPSGNVCPKPTSVTVNGITKNSANVTWESEGNLWNLQYKLASDTSWTSVNGLTIASHTLTGLTSNKNYSVRVQNVCDDESISGWRSANFTTRFAMPFLEEFPTTTIPQGWTRYSGLIANVLDGIAPTSTTSGWSVVASSNGVFDTHAKLNIYGTSCNYWMVTPDFLMEDNVQLTFDLALTKSSGTQQAVDPTQQADDKFAVLVHNTDNDTWTELRRWANTTSAVYKYNEISNTGEEVTFDLSSFAGQNIAIAFYGESTVSGGDNNLHIDNVLVDYIPSCTKPSDVVVSNITATSVTVDWEENNTPSAAGWTILANGVEFPANTHPFTVTGLTPDTVYTVKVRANCSTALADTSYWSHVANFTTPPTCPKPTHLTCESYTSTSAVLSWSAGGEENNWVVEYSTAANFANATSVSVEGDTTTEITGLTAETMLYVRVKAACSETDLSVWSDAIHFVPSETIILTVNDSTATNARVPVWGFDVDHLTQSLFIIPASALTDMQWGEIRRLTFYCSQSSINWGVASFKVYIKEVSNTVLSSTTPDYSTMNEVYAGTLSVSDNQMVVTLTTPYHYSDGNLMIGFDQTVVGSWSSSSWYGKVQTSNTALGGYDGTTSYAYQQFLPKTTFNYLPGEAPTCFAPTAHPATDITQTSATITWTNNDDEDPIGYSIMVNGTELTNVSITDTIYTLTGLNPSTLYTVKVRAACSTTDSSFWSYPISFHTECGIVVVTDEVAFSEDFNTLTSGIPQCWDNSDGTTTSENYKWNYHATGATGACVRFNSYSNSSGNTNMLKTPVLDLTQMETVPQLSFKYKNPTGGDFSVYVSTDGGTTYTTALATALPSTSDWTTEEIDIRNLPAYDQVVIVFKGTSNYGSGDAYIYLDDVTVGAGPIPCLPPTDVTIDQNYMLTWTGNAPSYNVHVVVGGDTVINAVSTTGIYVITGLNNGDVATVYIQSVCGPGDLSGWSDPITFTYTIEGVNNYGINANIYPNPTTGNVTVESNAIGADINVYDMFGKLMMTSKVTDVRTELDFNGLTSGVYTVRIANNSGITTVKVVKE